MNTASTFHQCIAWARRFQKWILLGLILLFVLSLGILVRRFYLVHSDLAPSRGGTYIEGSVGAFQPLNPWFIVQNDVNRDIVSLVFSGLLRYNPSTKKIEDDLATMRVSADAKTYTLTLKDGVQWHDSQKDHPHAVTADDVLFTFKTIQSSDFPNPILRQNFEGVSMEKIDARTVRFRLEQPYSFFPSNLTIGILPKDAFAGVPIAKIDQVTDFGLHPIGAGPYAFKSFVQTERSAEVTLERFERPKDPPYYVERVILRIFPDYPSLLSDVRNLDGVRIVPRNDRGDPVIPRSFVLRTYTLPQYVALFFNLDRSMLEDRNLRLGLQLGTNKQEVIDVIHEDAIVDTPLLEIDTSDWRYQYDAAAAQGALFESHWNLPEKLRLQTVLEHLDANRIGPLRLSPIVYLDTGATLTVTGSLSIASTGALLNGAALRRHPTHSGAWITELSASTGTGGLHMGDNLVRLIDGKGKVIDSAYVWRTDNSAHYRQASEEQHLVELFLQSKSDLAHTGNRIGVSDLIVDHGMLRRRSKTDPQGIRVNERGQVLSLRLLTSPSPASYAVVARNIQQQWRSLGVDIVIDIPATHGEFEQKLLKRDYDVLLFGQSLLDNLDAYPYWHSTGVQHISGKDVELRLDAYNLSQYASQKSDDLLEIIRETISEKERGGALKQLREILASDVPAIFLYSPRYTFAISSEVSGVELGSLSLHSDRFLSLHQWYLRERHHMKPGVSWWSFFPWILRM